MVGGRLVSSTLSAMIDYQLYADDRIQWFRAEAEMQRWQEQVESKLAELLRTSHSFQKMQEIWENLAQDQEPGYAAYAKQKAAMYGQMAGYCDEGLDHAGYGELRTLITSGASLLEVVERQRQAEKSSFE
jgi:hypothetical protein